MTYALTVLGACFCTAVALQTLVLCELSLLARFLLDLELIMMYIGISNGPFGNLESDSEKERKHNEVTVDESCWIYEQLWYV